jgi:hypothetical protein
VKQVNQNAIVAKWRAERDMYKEVVPRGSDGWIYFMGTPFLQAVKIGWAIKPEMRRDQLSTMSPLPLHLLTGFAGPIKHEQALHRWFKPLRYHGEWFRLEQPLADFIEETKRKHGSAPWPDKPFNRFAELPRTTAEEDAQMWRDTFERFRAEGGFEWVKPRA